MIMEKKTYIQPSQKARKIRVQSILAGSSNAENIPFGLGPANPEGSMMTRDRVIKNVD